LAEAAWALLPEDGSPVASGTLFDQLRGRLPDIAFFGDDSAPTVLWGILRRCNIIECGFAHLIARKQRGRAQSMLESAIVQIVKDMKTASAREIRREASNRHAYPHSKTSITDSIRNCLDRGQLRKLPGALYTVPAIDDDTLLEALALRDRTVRRAVNNA